MLSSAERGLQKKPLAPWQPLTMDSNVAYSVGPNAAPAKAMARTTAFARRTLPMLLAGAEREDAVSRDVLAVLTELVDVTARHRASTDVTSWITFDGVDVTVSVGDMGRTLPSPQDEPGLYLVHRVADDVGQHEGFDGGYVTWAAIRV
ncbi:hypothetical protein ACH4VR_19990 [Streptomyces sp. NPDC020883]|uniref:hypothetical protein n=1 Tax=Streptomyces sp. NPDC020883 TaxID=3365099 RepID=UPI0037BCC125